MRTAFVRSDPDTAFEIGSVSKALTGLLLADSADRGEVGLRAPLSDTLLELRGTESGDVSLQELATHTSGLPRLATGAGLRARALSSVVGMDPYRGITERDLLRAAKRVRSRSGSSYAYSNFGASLAGATLAAAGGMPYADLLHTRVLEPVGMGGTSARPGEVRVARGRHGGRPTANWRMEGYAPAGGVISTITDMARLTVALLRGEAPGMAALQPLLTPDHAAPDRRQAMFWIHDTVPGTGRTAIWHNGRTGGYSAHLAIYPQAQRGVVVLSGTDDSRATERVAVGLVRAMVGGRLRHDPDTASCSEPCRDAADSTVGPRRLWRNS